MLSSIELIDTLCEVTTLQSDIIRKQAYVIEQHKIIDSFADERDTAGGKLDTIEYELRSIYK